MGGGTSKDCWCEGHPGIKQVCPVQISQRYPYLTLADLSKTQETETNNAQYGLINSMVFASGTFHTGGLGLRLILGVILTLFVFWVRNNLKRDQPSPLFIVFDALKSVWLFFHRNLTNSCKHEVSKTL